MLSQPDPRLYRALTIVSDTALVIGALALTLSFVAPTVSPLPWIISAGIAGFVVVVARVAALRYRP